MTKNAILLEQVGVAFGGNRVLENVNASLPEGGLTVFIGPNGAGKTTLLLSLLGEVPHTGKITFSGDLREKLGYVPQTLQGETSTPVTCAEFLALNSSRRPLWLGIDRNTAKAVEEVLERVGMGGAGKRRMADLSGGETRRVLLACALLRRPRILLLDEPDAGVDTRGERLFWEILRDLRVKDGLSVVMVSHNLSLTAHYATHVLCVAGGGVLEGEPRTVMTSRNLMSVFGIPIHLYPEQCSAPHCLCPTCGAFEADAEDGRPGQGFILRPMEKREGDRR